MSKLAELKQQVKMNNVHNAGGYTTKILKEYEVEWLIEQAEKAERYEKSLKEIARWDQMLYSQREMGNFAKMALDLPIIPLKDTTL